MKQNFNPEMLSFYGPIAINEEFFSFRMSLFMPNWPVRFNDQHFKKLFESTLYEQAPIQMVSSSYWLGMTNMKTFEKIYFRWLDQMAQPRILDNIINTDDELQKRKLEMIYFIQYLQSIDKKEM